MAQLVPVASLLTGVAGLVGAQQQAQVQRRRQQEVQAAREAQLRLASEEQARQRRELLARTIASTRARLAAGGVSAAEGSGAALVSALEEEARTREQAEAQDFALRVAAGRRSLLDEQLNLAPFIRVGSQLATGLSSSVRSLLNL
ncbi:hypothetical protein FK498_11465 [Elioraea sp. Yellowstone]|jgi:hypothetical protein|uniref:hypothetical protein n=1 Tax=Elioraea sp. Yellowstone TaxID=2592070 RepID=UPI0011511F12|nr:hypothetical protein [Elioraea sp. Yellowstone]TQF77717.1 hypothetical protein FK498_11465 [Elioraea sp. Yellowstone]